MTSAYMPEFTRMQGLVVALAALPVYIGLIYFGEEHRAELAFGSAVGVISTIVIRRDLLRRRWFVLFVAFVALAHLVVVLLNPGTEFTRGEFGLFVLADLLSVIGLAYGVEKLISIWKRKSA